LKHGKVKKKKKNLIFYIINLDLSGVESVNL